MNSPLMSNSVLADLATGRTFRTANAQHMLGAQLSEIRILATFDFERHDVFSILSFFLFLFLGLKSRHGIAAAALQGFSAEITLRDGETVMLSSDSRTKSYRTHYSPEYRSSFFYSWLGKLMRLLWLDRLFGLHIDTVKHVKTRSYVFVTARILEGTMTEAPHR